MTKSAGSLVVFTVLVGVCAVPARAGTGKCSPDSAPVGPVCVDKYEASVWTLPTTSPSLVKKVQAGKATLEDLMRAGATQLGCAGPPYSETPFPESFPDDGNWTEPAYAISIPGVLPTTCASWFQAEQACRLSGKRLLTNQEWQAAAASTPDPGTDDAMSDCNIGRPFAQALTPTGSRGKCVSRWGVYDMVGNAAEYVADWGEQATTCALWLSGDSSCVGGNSAEGLPAATLRGGSFSDEDGGTKAGVFSVRMTDSPYYAVGTHGFRCGR